MVYRAVKSLPVKADDFLSDVESRKPGANPAECTHWGCSLMSSEQSVAHALSLFKHFREKRYIVSGVLEPSDGQMCLTPSNIDGHATFWMVQGRDVSSKFQVYYRGTKV
jgi:hypothetical protein